MEEYINITNMILEAQNHIAYCESVGFYAEAERYKWLVNKLSAIPTENVISCAEHNRILQEEKCCLATNIFTNLKDKIKFDGHTISVWKNDLVTTAEEYGVSI